MVDTESLVAVDVVEIIDGMGDDGEVGRFPGVNDGLVNPGSNHGNDLDTGFFGESENVFWGPGSENGVESVENGFPGVDFHNPIKHFWVVNLNNKTVEEGFVDGHREFDYFTKLGLNGCFIGIFTIGDNINIRMGLHKM